MLKLGCWFAPLFNVSIASRILKLKIAIEAALVWEFSFSNFLSRADICNALLRSNPQSHKNNALSLAKLLKNKEIIIKTYYLVSLINTNINNLLLQFKF